MSAQIGERNTERVTHRNGYRSRDWDTRVETMELRIPKIREGSYFPSLLEPRRRSEKALLNVVQKAYVEGLSARRVDDLIKSLGCDGISKSQVSRICRDLDQVVETLLGRPLDGGPYPYVWLDALTQKVCEGGRIVNVSVVVATGVNAQGQREVLGMDVGASEDGAFWLAFLRSLNARGLSGAELVISDAHQGLKQAIATVFTGAAWQRCRTHFMANLLTRVPKRSQPGVATMVRTIYKQLSPEEVHSQADRVAAQLREHLPQASQMLEDALSDILAFTAFPVSHWQKLWSNNPLERLNKESRRRTDVVGISPTGPQPVVWWRGAGRTARRMGRRSPLSHLRRRPRRRHLVGKQHPGGGSLDNITKDDANYTYGRDVTEPNAGRHPYAMCNKRRVPGRWPCRHPTR